MKNRDMPAKPCQEFHQGHCNTDLSKGLTKLEYAAIHILAALNSNSDSQFNYDNPKDALEQATLLFDQLEAEQDD